MVFENLTHLQLTADTNIKPFKCKDSDLNGFLIEDAKNYLASKMAVTYLFEDKEKNITVAYYSLLNDKITFDPEQRSFWNRLNRKIAKRLSCCKNWSIGCCRKLCGFRYWYRNN